MSAPQYVELRYVTRPILAAINERVKLEHPSASFDELLRLFPSDGDSDSDGAERFAVTVYHRKERNTQIRVPLDDEQHLLIVIPTPEFDALPVARVPVDQSGGAS